MAKKNPSCPNDGRHKTIMSDEGEGLFFCPHCKISVDANGKEITKYFDTENDGDNVVVDTYNEINGNLYMKATVSKIRIIKDAEFLVQVYFSMNRELEDDFSIPFLRKNANKLFKIGHTYEISIQEHSSDPIDFPKTLLELEPEER